MKIAAAVLSGLLIVAVTIYAVWWLPPRMMTWPYAGMSTTWGGLSLPDSLKAQTDLRHTIVETLQVIATAITAIALVYTLQFTARNVRLAENAAKEARDASEKNLNAQKQTRFGERFSKATEQLSNTSEAVKVGAIYALARIARESEEDHWPIVELLCAFLRSQRPARQQQARGRVSPSEPAKAVAFFLRKRCHTREQAGQVIDLSLTNLHGLNLEKARLTNAVLDGAELDGVRLVGAFLSHAKMANVGATDTDFTDAHLDGCFLNGADLTRATLTRADLRDASVLNAKADPIIGPVFNVTQQQKDSVKGIWNEILPTPH